MKKALLTLFSILLTACACAQASASTDFEIEVSFADLPLESHLTFYAVENRGVNTLSSCRYNIDTVHRNVTFSGTLHYIVGADVITFIITEQSTVREKSLGVVVKHHVLQHHAITIGDLGAHKSFLEPLALSENKPFTVIDSI